MTSDRYFCNDKERVSCRKVAVLDAVMAVRRRLMKAVFLLSDESSDVFVGSTSDHHMSQNGAMSEQAVVLTFTGPSSSIAIAKLALRLRQSFPRNAEE